MRTYEKVFGVDHINTAGTIHNLGNVYACQGKYNYAIACYERALKVFQRETRLHPDTASVHECIAVGLLQHLRILLNEMSNIGVTYHVQGQIEDATKLRETVPTGSYEEVGEDHLDTPSAMANLRLTHHVIGRRDDAAKLRETVLEARRRLLGMSIWIR